MMDAFLALDWECSNLKLLIISKAVKPAVEGSKRPFPRSSGASIANGSLMLWSSGVAVGFPDIIHAHRSSPEDVYLSTLHADGGY